MINGLYTDQLSFFDENEFTNHTESVLNGQYDAYFAVFAELETCSSIYSSFMYVEERDILIGAYRTEMANNSNIIGILSYDGNCLSTEYYNQTTMKRNGTFASRAQCDFVPKDRVWYKLAINNSSAARWTNPYVFFLDEQYGMSLVKRVDYNNETFVFVVEYSLDSLELLSQKLDMPLNGTMYIMSDDTSVFASTQPHQIDINTCNYTTTNHNGTHALESNESNYCVVKFL